MNKKTYQMWFFATEVQFQRRLDQNKSYQIIIAYTTTANKQRKSNRHQIRSILPHRVVYIIRVVNIALLLRCGKDDTMGETPRICLLSKTIIQNFINFGLYNARHNFTVNIIIFYLQSDMPQVLFRNNNMQLPVYRYKLNLKKQILEKRLLFLRSYFVQCVRLRL